MRFVDQNHFVIIHKPEAEPTEINVGTLDSAKLWQEIFARNHGDEAVEIVRRTFYEFDEHLKNSAPTDT